MSTEGLSRDHVVELLNEAKLSDREDKQELISQVFELVFHREPSLLAEFLPHLLEFEHDKIQSIRRHVINVAEDVIKQFPQYISGCVATITRLLDDTSPNVVKRAILCATNTWRSMLSYLCCEAAFNEKPQLWANLVQLKEGITHLTVSSKHDAVKQHAFKFMETLILSCSRSPQGKSDKFSLDAILQGQPFVAISELEGDAEKKLKLLIDQLQNPASTSITLVVVINAMGAIARQRVQFNSLIIPTLANFQPPASWTDSQRQSVNHALKNTLTILKVDDMPPPRDKGPKSEKREREPQPADSTDSKRIKTESKQDNEWPSTPLPSEKGALSSDEQATILLLLKQLPPELIADLVIENLSVSSIPTPVETFTPQPPPPVDPRLKAAPPADPRLKPAPPVDPRLKAAAASTQTALLPSPPNIPPPGILPGLLPQNILPQNVSQFLPGISPFPQNALPQSPPLPQNPPSLPLPFPQNTSLLQNPPFPPTYQVSSPPIEQPQTQAKPKPLSLTPVALSEEQLQQLGDAAFLRVMTAKQGAVVAGRSELWIGLVSRLASSRPLSSASVSSLLQYIVGDLQANKDLVHSWLCQEFLSSPTARYPQLLSALLSLLKDQKWDPKDRSLVSLIVDAPAVLESAWQIVCEYSTSSAENSLKVTLGLSVLRDLVVWRPLERTQALSLLLEYTSHPEEHVRSPAVRLVANQLYPLVALTKLVEDHALASLRTLANVQTLADTQVKEPGEQKDSEEVLEPEPEIKKDTTNIQTITEEQIQLHLFLFFALSTKNHDLLPNLLDAYVQASQGTRKVILKQMAEPVKTIGMNSQQLVQLIVSCPKGGEAFILHMLRILTEGGATRPSSNLVTSVKALHKRTQDARLLIPIVGGLDKEEVIGLLPKFITLPSPTVKALIKRLAVGPSPLSPTELLVALHHVEDVPIKRTLEATQYCLDLTQVYKQDVMAVVLSQLYSGAHIPPLFMRTVMQTLKQYSKLSGYIAEILGNLVSKQVWADKILWEGFIRCCQITKPTSFKALLKLPPAQLEDALKFAPDLKEPLSKAVKQQQQQRLLSKAVLKVLGLDDQPTTTPAPAPAPTPPAATTSVPATKEEAETEEGKDK